MARTDTPYAGRGAKPRPRLIETDDQKAERLQRLRRLRDLRLAQAHQQTLAAIDDEYVDDPVGWAEWRLGAFLWSKQREVLEAVRDEPRVAVPSAHSTGKTFTAATAVGWWLTTHTPGTAFAVTSAPTNMQVKTLLWREIRRAHNAGRLPGRLNLTEWWLNDEIVGFGRKSRDTEPDAFQGIHAEHLLIVIDEANGFAKVLWEAADTLAAGGNAHILAIGNPDSANSHFAKVCKPASGWHVIRIPAEVTPNFTGEEVPDHVAAQLLQRAWVKRKTREWGTDHPYYFSKIKAQFPETDEATVISQALIDKAHAAWDEWAEDATAEPHVLSVDVARFGTDQTVFGVRHGPRFAIVGTMPQSRTTQVSGKALFYARLHGVDDIRVDSIGVGGGVEDELVQAKAQDHRTLVGTDVTGMEAGSRPPTKPDVYLNARAEWWFHLRDLMRDGLVALDPSDDDTAAQLIDVHYDVVGGQGKNAGKIKVESKEDMRARGVASPDRADTVVMAFAPKPPPAPPPSSFGEDDVPGAGADVGVPADDRNIHDVNF